MIPYANLALVILVTMTGMLLMLAAMRRIPVGYRGVQFRLGRLVKELPPGLAWVVPLADSVMLVNLGEQTIALPAGLTLSSGHQQYRVEGSFTCRIIEPIPAVMAATQARQDLAVVMGEQILAEIKQLGAAAAFERPAQAQQQVLDALNAKMSAAWQLKFTKMELTLVVNK